MVFVSPFFGAVLAAAVASATHIRLGRRGAEFIAALSMAIGNLLLVLHPPWPAFLVVLGFAGYGIAGLDPVCSSWVGSLHHSAGLLGMLQGFFGIGSTITPLIVDRMIEAGIPWYKYYYVPVGTSHFKSDPGRN
jgi:fucose permease